jgi:hypothetical protein
MFDPEVIASSLEPNVGTYPNSPLISLAISLKRIADTLNLVTAHNAFSVTAIAVSQQRTDL